MNLQIKVPVKKLNRLFDDIAKKHNKIVVRAMNTTSKKTVTFVSRNLSKSTGLNVGSIKGRITQRYATPTRKYFEWVMQGRRLSLPKAVAIKGGVKYTNSRGKRTNRTNYEQPGSSKPFMITTPDGGRLAVFVPESRNHFRGKSRKVGKIAWHSLPWLLSGDWEQQAKEYALSIMRTEFSNAMKSAKYIP